MQQKRPRLLNKAGHYQLPSGQSLGFGPKDVRGLSAAMTHIFYGETRRNGKRVGGHAYVQVELEMREGQIAFPQDWSAADIEAACRKVIEDPDAIGSWGYTKHWVDRVVDGVHVRVQIRQRRSGPAVLTAHPMGGQGVVRVHNGVLTPVPEP